MACFPNHPDLGFISKRLSDGLDPLSLSTLIIMRMKTIARFYRIPHLLLGGSPGRSSGASPPSSLSVAASTPSAYSATLALALSSATTPPQGEAMVMKKEKEEAITSTVGIASLALEGLESGAPP